MNKKVFLTMLLVILASAFTVNIYAMDFFNEIINQGTNFGGTVEEVNCADAENITILACFVKESVAPIVSLIGNLVFAAITVILGAKYIWSGAEGKSDVMESLPVFIAAVVFFYLGGTIVTWVIGASSGIASATSWQTISGKIIGTINMFVRYAAFGGILYMGLKYMLSSAEGKSQVKTNMGGVILGIIFVFMASGAVDFIIKIAEGAF